MKIFTNIVKVLVALSAVAGAVYAVAAYGDKLVAWAKKLLKNCPCADAEPVAEDVPAEESPDQDVPAEDAPAEEAAPAEQPAPAEVAPDGAPLAEDSDFEG